MLQAHKFRCYRLHVSFKQSPPITDISWILPVGGEIAIEGNKVQRVLLLIIIPRERERELLKKDLRLDVIQGCWLLVLLYKHSRVFCCTLITCNFHYLLSRTKQIIIFTYGDNFDVEHQSELLEEKIEKQKNDIRVIFLIWLLGI